MPGSQPRGKQVLKPGGIYVHADHRDLADGLAGAGAGDAASSASKIVPDVDAGEVRITATSSAGDGRASRSRRSPRDGDATVGEASGRGRRAARDQDRERQALEPDQPVPLRPAGRRSRGATTVATATSACGRSRSAKDDAGINRLLLNGKPLFQVGPLDQGWWPDGLYTAPTDEALKYDLEVTKKLGFNMIRKHVKVEPDRWYYWCDKLGILVWQDMPSGDNTGRRAAKQQFAARARAR